MVTSPARQLGVEVGKLLPGAVGAQEVVAAAVGQTAHGGVGKALHACQCLHQSTIAACRPDVQLLPCFRGLFRRGTSQCLGMACILCFAGGNRIHRDACPDSSLLQLRNELDGTVLLPSGRIQDKQITHGFLLCA